EFQESQTDAARVEPVHSQVPQQNRENEGEAWVVAVPRRHRGSNHWRGRQQIRFSLEFKRVRPARSRKRIRRESANVETSSLASSSSRSRGSCRPPCMRYVLVVGPRTRDAASSSGCTDFVPARSALTLDASGQNGQSSEQAETGPAKGPAHIAWHQHRSEERRAGTEGGSERTAE